MAVKLALLSFEFRACKGLKYEPELDHEFAASDTQLNQSIQPVVEKAFAKIRRCVAMTISSSFNFGHSSIHNINNFLHTATAVIDAEVQHADGSCGNTATTLQLRFYRLEPDSSYKVTLDIEEMPSSSTPYNDETAFSTENGLNNGKLKSLARLLDQKFQLGGKIECIPMIKRGRVDKPHFLVTSDERVVEYDFKELLFHKQSEYQDVKVVSSPSLGNTLLLDDLQNLAECDLHYTHVLMNKDKICYTNKKILILGGGDGALLHELLKENPKYVTVAEIDPVVIEASRLHLRPFGDTLDSLVGPNYKVHIEDCLILLQEWYDEGRTFDYIFNDLTDVPVSKREEAHIAFQPNLVQKDNLWHFIEAIYSLAIDNLEDDGAYMTHTTGRGNAAALDEFERFLKNTRMPVKFESRAAFVPSFMETWVFYTIRKNPAKFSRPSHRALACRDLKGARRYVEKKYSLEPYQGDKDDYHR